MNKDLEKIKAAYKQADEEGKVFMKKIHTPGIEGIIATIQMNARTNIKTSLTYHAGEIELKGSVNG